MNKQIILIGLLAALAYNASPTEAQALEASNSNIEQVNVVFTDRKGIEVNSTAQSWQLKAERISKIEFDELYKKHFKKIEIEKIEDFETVKEMLDGIAFWFPEHESLEKIKTRNGNTVMVNEPLEEGEDIEFFADYAPVFIAYYPTEDILLLEGGHSSSYAFSMTTGEDIDIAGDPEACLLSPSGKLRFMSYDNGQYNINKLQTVVDDSYHNVADIQELDSYTFSYMMDMFWVGDSALYFKDEVEDEKTNENIYYKLTITNSN